MSDEREGGSMSDTSDVESGADRDLEREFGFEPAVSATGKVDAGEVGTGELDAGAENETDTGNRPSAGRRIGPRVLRRRTRAGTPRPPLRRRIGAVLILFIALGSMGSIYAAFAASSGASNTGDTAADITAGRQLYSTSCVTCHGANLEGVEGNGPSLIGVGSAAVYFQVSTGRMPLAEQGAYAARKVAKFDDKQTDQLGAYVQSVGGGPEIPEGALRADSSQLGKGGELFRLNCASCHGTTLKGAPLSAGKIAPSLNDATDKQIYAAMLSGPESMPPFSDNQITPSEKRAIVSYIQTMKATKDPGGNGIDRIGPVSEAIVIWVGGVGALMIAILWIGARAR